MNKDIPVEGWEAFHTAQRGYDYETKGYDKLLDSYNVISCPEFVKG